MENVAHMNKKFMICRISAQNLNGTALHADIPPRGWNSYDSFCWTVSEQEFLQSASIVSNRLKDYGYEVSCY